MMARLLREWGLVFLLAIVIAFTLRLLVIQAYEIPSDSMLPTLRDGNRVTVNRLSYDFGEIERGQVVVFTRPPSLEGKDDVIKRVLALPGETIRFVDNEVYVDGLRAVEPYLLEESSTRPRGTIPGCAQERPAVDLCTIPEGHVFVMGDNRTGSVDSRTFGPIPDDTIVGRAFWRVWPLTDVAQL